VVNLARRGFAAKGSEIARTAVEAAEEYARQAHAKVRKREPSRL
jgi:alkylation response protein AidB-like acyl-CoA dehydrogenase